MYINIYIYICIVPLAALCVEDSPLFRGKLTQNHGGKPGLEPLSVIPRTSIFEASSLGMAYFGSAWSLLWLGVGKVQGPSAIPSTPRVR